MSEIIEPEQLKCTARPSHQSDVLDTLACKFWLEGKGWKDYPDVNILNIQFDETMVRKTFGTSEKMIVNFPIRDKYDSKHAVCEISEAEYGSKNINCRLIEE